MKNIEQHEILIKHVKDWVAEHEQHLPIGIKHWDIGIIEKQSNEKETVLTKLFFGKYEANDISVVSFYKPHSRIIEL